MSDRAAPLHEAAREAFKMHPETMMKMLAMKYTMRTATVLLCGAALALPALAQNGGSPAPGQEQTQGGPPPGGGPGGPGGPGGRRGGGGGPEQRVAMLTKQLDLTTEQAAKVKTILDEGRAQMMAARNDSSGGDMREKMMAMRKAETDKIRVLLTADQATKLDALEKRQRERQGGGPGGDGPPPPPPPPQN